MPICVAISAKRRSAVHRTAPGVITVDASNDKSTKPHPFPNNMCCSKNTNVSAIDASRQARSIESADNVSARGAGGVPQANSACTMGCINTRSWLSNSFKWWFASRKCRTHTDVSTRIDVGINELSLGAIHRSCVQYPTCLVLPHRVLLNAFLPQHE